MIRGNERFITQVYILVDFLFIQLAILAAWWIKFESSFSSEVLRLPFSTYYVWSLAYGVLAIFLGFTFAIYHSKRKKSFRFEFLKIVQIHIVSIMVLVSMLFVFNIVHFSRTFLFLLVLFSVIFVALYRYFAKLCLWYLRKKGFNKQFVLIVGAGTVGKRFSNIIKAQPELGLEVIGFLDDYIVEHDADYEPIRGKVNQLGHLLESKPIDEVILALPLSAHKKYKQIIEICDKAGVRLLIIPDYYDVLPAKFVVDQVGEIPLINVREVPLDEIRNRMLKRGFDIIFSIFAIVLLSPLYIFISIGVKLTSKGSVIFKQERVGFNKNKFMMYKFRSMIDMPLEMSDSEWTIKDDPRKTSFGTFLRKTSLDELPQFFNVLKGDMSVVGPRPEREYFVEQFKEEIPKYMVKHHVKPGITGWAQVNGLRGDTSIIKRIQLDLFYIENWSFLLDIKIVFKTIKNGFLNKNAY
ncbi:UDP-phosphate glucose phosphotransferase [Bacillus sp. TS-2]|nr:UDP-phosphate glucose phosphotransferase [Bacillus sp. TS-2]